MTINMILKNNKKIIGNEPVRLSYLRSYASKKLDKKISSSAIRNIFIGNDNFYNFKYKHVGYDRYVPTTFKSVEDVISYMCNKRVFMWDSVSLGKKLGLNNQTIMKHSIIIFGKETKHDVAMKDFFKDIVKVTYIYAEKKEIEAYKQLKTISYLSEDRNLLKTYLLSNNIDKTMINKWYSLLSECNKTTEFKAVCWDVSQWVK